MTTLESYRPEDSGSSPAPPMLPERPPARFQFSLKQLLAFMFASAIVAAGLRQLILYVGQLSAPEQFGIVNVTLCGLAFGGLAYFFLRMPFIAVKLGRSRGRWREIQQHRRDLQAWGEARKREQGEQTDVPRGD
jgi:hypothetical protein